MMSGVAGTHPHALLYAGHDYFADCNTVAAKTLRASPTCDDSSDSMTSIPTDRS
jgi:hypothetical protein